MHSEKNNIRSKIKWPVLFLLLISCIDRIDFDSPSATLLTIVEGSISDNPGPYTVKLSKGLTLNESSTSVIPIKKAKLKLYDDSGGVEDFKETSPGTYQTSGKIKGEVNHSYHISIETEEGKMLESEAEKINPVGDIENIRYEFESKTSVKKFGEVNSDVFNIYVDGKGIEGNDSYLRWRSTETYKVVTFPELHETFIQGYIPFKDPWPCSGYQVIPGPLYSGGLLEKIAECTCCTCWADIYEVLPQVSEIKFIKNNQFSNIKVGEVAINNIKFSDKVLIVVEQMSLSKKGYDFFKLIKSQKEGASSIFQSPAAEIQGNIKSINGTDQIVGLFWATSIKKKAIFINPSEIPYPIPSIFVDTRRCTDYENSSTTKPEFWQ
jgi:Domain of unknown function (DUF4249)